MKLRTWLCLALCLCLTASLAGCGGDDTAVFVQSVSTLVGMGSIAPGDRFAGMVVSENVTEIKKDSEKTIKEVLVKEGDDVEEGQELFSYDTDQLQLTLDKQRLELEQLNATIENYNQQIKELEKERTERMAKADAIGGFMFRLRELDQPLEHFDERLWLEVIDCVTVCRDGLMFKFQGGKEIQV